MKKTVLFAAAVVLSLASCTKVKKSATTMEVSSNVTATTHADLDVASSRISYSFRPTAKERRGGKQNCINAAIREALKQHGNADVLLAPQYEVVTFNGLIRRGVVKEVIVSGYPATYKNFKVK